jgi:hypothetical protein
MGNAFMRADWLIATMLRCALLSLFFEELHVGALGLVDRA